MSEHKVYEFFVYQSPYSFMRAYLNGVPVHRGPPTEGITRNRTLTANHWLVPGANTLTFEIATGTRASKATFLVQESGNDDNVLARFEFPADPDVPPVYPIVHTEAFEAPGITAAAPWADAERVPEWKEVPADLRLAVQSFHHAFAVTDVSAAMTQLELKAKHLQAAYPLDPRLGPDGMRARFAAMMPGLKAEPFVPEELLFERHCDGRVVYVTCVDGRRAVRASASEEQAFETDLWLTKKNGVWRIFA